MSALRTIATGWWLGAMLAQPATAQMPARVEAALDRRLAGASADSLWPAVRRLYEARAFKPGWIDSGGVVPGARELQRALERARAEGLDPSDYPVSAVDALIAGPPDSDSLAALDVSTTYALLRYATDLTLGRVPPGLTDTMWSASVRRPDPVRLAAAGLETGRVGKTLGSMSPAHPGATRLRAALETYRRIADRGGWPVVPTGYSLAVGVHGPRVRLLQRRLRETGDLVGGDSLDRFSQAIDSAVRRFQSRHGLAPDGIVGPLTLAALNVPAQQRVQELALNLERWRWLPSDLGRRYIMVNAPAYTLALMDTGGLVATYPVIVGRKDWPTPIVSAALTEIVFNPRWNIPRSIALAEVIPAERRASGYMAREGIHVLSDTTDQARELDPDSVDWRGLTDSAFGMRLWMDPGPGNPLGRIRLAVPNRFNVALHDTPDTALFAEPARTFSHGCVRVAGVINLATTLAQELADWPGDSVQAALATPEERHLRLPRPMPVHFVYWTAWVDPDGTVQFRPDEYGWDEELERAIQSRARQQEANAR